ncbi:hypothetical protein [Streptomyces sp. AS02]|uniref:hypothetical protein n=1 Tax=Streptomyces sp. AS02 TaxID=2938946 RepID=UPI00202187AE|nr:hypothetical protein [Streptomyces sp. AS02]MCL8014509.1 hypothetical protein [Streptomyces sp. AS02]
MEVPSGVRKFVNVVLCLTAVAGTVWSGTQIWQVLNGRHQINEACADLVPAGRVLALSPAGGTISHRVADEGTIDLDAALPQDCEIFSTEAGEEYGTDSGERWFFTAAVGTLPDDEPVIPEDPVDSLLDEWGDHTYPGQPLGGGIAGVVTDTGVTVELPCPEGEADGPVKTLWSRASLVDPGPPFTENGQLTAHDRNTLAQIAVTTANNLAGRLGCADRLPDPPQDIPALTEGPLPASRADGTCAWYRKAGFARQPRLADQVLESRPDDKLWDETCGLVLSDGREAEVAYSDAARRADVDRPSRPGAWFVSLHTYSGEDAKNVQLRRAIPRESPVLAEPGKAGRGDGDDSLWWASSVCDGRPQIHTMTIAWEYDELTTPAYEKVFRAYVDDVTHRRGCTNLKFPAHTTFTEQASS